MLERKNNTSGNFFFFSGTISIVMTRKWWWWSRPMTELGLLFECRQGWKGVRKEYLDVELAVRKFVYGPSF